MRVRNSLPFLHLLQRHFAVGHYLYLRLHHRRYHQREVNSGSGRVMDSGLGLGLGPAMDLGSGLGPAMDLGLGLGLGLGPVTDLGLGLGWVVSPV